MVICKTCSMEKPFEAFYQSNRTRCKACVKASATAYRQDNLERIRAYDRMRASQPHRMANNFAQSSAWRETYPNRRLAQGKVGYAVRTGKLQKLPCWVCGADKSVAHHPDYDRPLDVVWLCQPHHKQAHALVKD